jgi:hypothetical protein
MRPSVSLLVLVLASLALGACGSSPAARSDGSMASSPSFTTPSPSDTVTSSPPATPSMTPGAVGSGAATSQPTSLVGSIVATLADDGLRVRSAPRVGEDSDLMEPLLPLGTQLLVLDGPMSASGYAWYDVVPLTSRNLPSGWVASASRDGEPWVATADFDCPPVPTDLAALAALPPGVGLACFPRRPITVEARLVECNCDADGGWFEPSWFFAGSGSPNLLVDPKAVEPPDAVDDWFVLNLDPGGEHPDVLPIGQVVEVTGMFDHPAASGCTLTGMDRAPAPSQGCRLEFAVTRLSVFGP